MSTSARIFPCSAAASQSCVTTDSHVKKMIAASVSNIIPTATGRFDGRRSGPRSKTAQAIALQTQAQE